MIKQKFRKKPVVIEAYQTDKEMEIETLEGTMHASIGDWIITGVRGEPYPCKPDIFEKTYEPVVEVKDEESRTMTRQEAIALVREVSNYMATRPEIDEAIDMAIEALEQQTAKCDNCKYSEETDGMNCYECLKGMSDNFEALDQDEIVRCKDCKYWHEWENGTGSCHRSDIMWVGSDYYDYCSFAEKRESDEE